MAYEQPIGDVHKHVDPFPSVWRQRMQPKVMTCPSHKEEDDQRRHAEQLEWKFSDAIESRIATQEAYQRVHITERVKLDNTECSMDCSQPEHRDTKMTPVVQQWQKAGLKPAQWTDAEDYMEYQKGRGAEGSDHERLRSRVGIDQGSNRDKNAYVHQQNSGQAEVVDLLLPIPENRPVMDTHRALAKINRSGSTTARISQARL
jgi:hypothetical protein